MILMGGAAPQFLNHMSALSRPALKDGEPEPPPGGGNLDELLTELEEQITPSNPSSAARAPRTAHRDPWATPLHKEPDKEGGSRMDLYQSPAYPGEFRRACGGNQQEDEQESCVEIAPLNGADDAFALRDSKNPAAGTLRFTGDELRAAGITV